MPIDESDRQRLLELVPKLMLLADWIDMKSGSIEDEVQQDLRWLSEQLPLLLEERERYESFLGLIGTSVELALNPEEAKDASD